MGWNRRLNREGLLRVNAQVDLQNDACARLRVRNDPVNIPEGLFAAGWLVRGPAGPNLPELNAELEGRVPLEWFVCCY